MKSRKEEIILNHLPAKKRNSIAVSSNSKNSSVRVSNRTVGSVNRVNNYLPLYKNETIPRQAKRPQSKEARPDENDTTTDNSAFHPINITESRKSMLHKTLMMANKLNHHSVIVKFEAINARIKNITYEIQKARSDRLELKRDLATYEYNLGDSINLKSTLSLLNQESLNIPNVNDIVSEIDCDDKNMVQLLKQTMNAVQSLEDKYTKLENQVTNPVFISETYSLRNTKDVEELFNIYLGVDSISSQQCFVKIRGDRWLEKVEISVETLQKHELFISLRLNLTNSYVEFKDMRKIIKQRIVPNLYICASTNNFKLKYDPEHGKKYLCILVDIKNWKLTSIYLTQKDNFILLSAANEDFSLKLEQNDLEGVQISLENIKELAKLIKRKLFFVSDQNNFKWNSKNESNFPFKLKEENSKLLDSKYLQEVFHLSQYILACKLKLKLKESKFIIKIYKSKNRFKIFFSVGKDVIEINSGTKIFNLISDLQFEDISKEPVTLLNSLEIRHVLRKSFPDLFKD